MVKLLIPDLPSTSQYLPYLQEMEERNWFTNFGPLENQLTEKVLDLLAHLHGTSDFEVALTSSGTAALQAAILSQPLPQDATFLVPTFTFPGTIMAILQLGYKVRLADIDNNGLLCSEQLSDEMLETVDAFLPVGALGKYVDLAQWKSVAKNLNKILIADCAASFPYQAPTCSMAFSLHATKPIGIGEGGIVVRPKSDLPPLKSILNFGFDKGKVKFSGGNFKMSEIHAAIGLSQLERFNKIQQKRLTIFEKLSKGISALKFLRLLYNRKETLLSGFTAPYFPLVLNASVNMEHFQQFLDSHKIENRRWYFPPLHEQTFCKKSPNVITESQYPIADQVKRRVICLPMHSKLNSQETEEILTVLKQYQNDHIHRVNLN